MRFLFVLLLLCAPAVADIEMDGRSNNELAVEALIEKFDSPDIIVRYEPWWQTYPAFVVYAEAAASFGESAVDPLIATLTASVCEDGNSQVGVAAAIALEAIGPASIKAHPLLKEMLQSDDDRTNILACGIIRGIGPDAIELVDLVMTHLDNENFHVQYWACRALAGIGPNAAPAADRLCEALKDGAASVRRNAAITLSSIADGLEDQSAVIQALEKATEDRAHPVRIEAEKALLKIRTPKAKC